jgi:hypothetical protein
MTIALARGQIEEAMALLEDAGSAAPPGLYAALVRARDFLAQAAEMSAARLPMAHYTPMPITTEEVEGGEKE